MSRASRRSSHNVAVSAADEVDRLYQQPLSDFTRERNALAKTLSGAEAQHVRALAKPTVVAWAVNQVYWRARAAFDRAMKAGADLRKAQLAALQGKAADLRAATDAHRRTIADAVAEAERLAANAGSKPSPDALARTFEALSLAPSPPEPPGRLTDALQPAGFEALAGITPKKGAAPYAPAKPAHDARAEIDTRDRERGRRGGAHPKEDAKAARARAAEERKREADAREAAAAARQREADLRKADAALARAEASEKLARATWERAHDALLEARRTRDELRKAH
jgi:hypothetical protein